MEHNKDNPITHRGGSIPPEEGVSMNPNAGGKVNRWKDKIYSHQLMEYVNFAFGEEERRVYEVFFNQMAEDNNLMSAQDLMLLDMVVFDFIRLKRLQKVIHNEGDTYKMDIGRGRVVTKVNEASYLHNAIMTQLRNNLREMMMTRKEVTKKQLGMGTKDFATWLSKEAKVVEAEVKDANNTAAN